MFRTISRVSLGIGIILSLAASIPAQDKPPPQKPGKPKEPGGYRDLFLKPEKLSDYWDAIHFELEVGRPDLAAKWLHELLAKQPPFEDKDWVALEEQIGTASFLRLRLISHWSDDLKIDAQARKDADALNDRVNTARKNVLGNAETIRRYIRMLGGDREDRNYAIKHLQQARTLAVPILLAELASTKGEEHENLMELFPLLHPETLLPLIAALDVDDTNLRLDLLEVLMQPRNRDATPYLQKAVPMLYYLSGSSKVPPRVRDKAKDVLARLTLTDRAKLSPPAVFLTREAERYYRHAVPLEKTNILIWRWDPKTGMPVQGLPGEKAVTPTLAEEYYGLRYARQALDIDPTYAPAQQVLLGLLLEKAAERAGGPDQSLPRDLRDLLATVNPELITQILDQALTDHRGSVALGAVRALGDLAETRALKPTGRGEPALVRALSYPDRRIQFAAADALLRIPAAPAPTAAGRVVDVLRRYAAIDPQPKARRPVVLLGIADPAAGDAIAAAARTAGFDVERATSGTAVLERLKKSADVDALLISTELPDPGLAYLLAQLRDDPSFGAVPLWLVTPWDTEENLKMRQAELDIALRRFRLEKLKLTEERQRVESLYLKNKGPAATPFKVRLDRIDKELQGDWFALTGKSFTSLADEGVPETVLSKLKNLKDKESNSQASFLSELAKVLSREELAHHQERLLKHAPQGFSQEKEDRILAERKTIERQLLSAPPARDAALRRMLVHYRRTWVLPESSASDPRFLKAALKEPLDNVAGQPLTPMESKAYAERSLEWLARMARGEVTGYDFTPAEPALYKALQTPALGENALKAAIEATGRLPAGRGGDQPQRELTGIVLGANQPVPLRLAAATELLRRIQRTSPVLSKTEVQKLEEIRSSPETDDKLREAVARVIGALRPDARLTGERLQKFEPKPPAPPKEDKPKEEKP